jgi:hypothetical protein
VSVTLGRTKEKEYQKDVQREESRANREAVVRKQKIREQERLDEISRSKVDFSNE